MGIWKQVVSTLKQEPMEMAQTAMSQITGDLGTSERGQAQSDPAGGNAPLTPQNAKRYEELQGRKDEIELKKLRAELHGEWAVTTNIEQGMQQARAESDQKEEQRKKAMEQQKEEKKMEELQVKKAEDENLAVKAAREASSAENKAWGAG